jgi:serine/threonine protein kinase/Tfp pilus assembly protein PilF
MATLCRTCRTENSDTANYCSNCASALRGPDALDITRPLPAPGTQAYESRTWDLQTGSVFGGRYQIIDQLGRGGMGRVYRAVDTKTREEVAIKLIRPDIAEDKRTLERFVNEIKLAHKISHRNIGKMYHLGEDQGLHYITMEYVPGEDLKSFIRRSRRLDIATTVAIAKQVCSGLSEAHDADIVHRDLKPGNIMIDRDGNAKILDFGIARAVGTQGVTAEGSVLGTPEYMSPEQVEGRESDRRSDIYSFGVILFEMVTGRLPFAADTPFVVAFKHQSEKPTPPEDLNPQTPPQLSAIILRCLAKDPASRYQTAEDLCRDLGQVEETLHATPLPSPWAKPTTRLTALKAAAQRFPWRKAIIPVLAFLGIMVGGVLVSQVLPKAKGAVRTVAIVGFENLTGEAAYEYLKKAIPNLLITSLEQSKYLDVVSWERLNDLAGAKDRDVVSAADRDSWFDACRRSGVDALVLGSFTKADTLFATDAKIYDVQSKNLLKSVGSRGEGVGSILRNQIDELSVEIAKGVGLSARAASKGALPITKVATASMDAYQLFLKGQEDFDRYYFDDARVSLEKAVEADPSFAMAHFYLARVYGQLSDAPKATKALDQFKKLSQINPGKGKDALWTAAVTAGLDKDPDKYVKLLNEIVKSDPNDKRAYADLGAFYYRTKSKYPEAVAALTKALELDPDFGYPQNLLAYAYAEMGEKDKAIAMFERYAASHPGEANPLDSMGDLHFLYGEFDKARAKYQQALAVRADFPSQWKLAYLYAMDGDYDAALRWVDDMITRSQTDGRRADGHQWKGLYYSLMGRINDALAELGTAETLARTSGNKDLADIVLRDELWIAYDWGRLDQFKSATEKRMTYRREAGLGTASLNKIYSLLYAGLHDVLAGNTAGARTKLAAMEGLAAGIDEKEKKFNLLASNHLQREILFAEGDFAGAAKVFDQAPELKIDLSMPTTVQGKNLPYLADLPARAALKKGERAGAIKMYERLVSPEPKDREGALIHPFSRLRLAALYEATGQIDRAFEQYKILARAWRQADPGLPEVETVNRKLSELKSRVPKPKGGPMESFYSAPFIGGY